MASAIAPAHLTDQVVQRHAQRQQCERSRVEMMQSYAETRSCRREFLLNYFGDSLAPPCGACDICDAGLAQPDPRASLPFPINSRVIHSALGSGTVLRYADDAMVVLFDEHGYQNLLTDLVLDQGILSPECAIL